MAIESDRKLFNNNKKNRKEAVETICCEELNNEHQTNTPSAEWRVCSILNEISSYNEGFSNKKKTIHTGMLRSELVFRAYAMHTIQTSWNFLKPETCSSR